MNPKDIYFESVSKKIKETYEELGYGFSAFNKKEAAKDFLVKNIAPDATVTFGGSSTLKEVGILDILRNSGYKNFIDRDVPELKEHAQAAAFTADVFLSSTNAMTLDGILTNTDKIGNRVAPMLYGPKKVYIVSGINKLVTNREEAFARTANRAAVINNLRFGKQNPCVNTMRCMNCKLDDRICVYTTQIRGSFPKGRIHVVLINEELGF